MSGYEMKTTFSHASIRPNVGEGKGERARGGLKSQTPHLDDFTIIIGGCKSAWALSFEQC